MALPRLVPFSCHSLNGAILAFPVNSLADELAMLAHLKAVAGEESDRTFSMVVADLSQAANLGSTSLFCIIDSHSREARRS